ncbi:MAG: tetratricopeptide repeat protein [Bacteroidales bacterium]|nr:tetratricopeptide repeat protein [Bacteroidales bacterium]
MKKVNTILLLLALMVQVSATSDSLFQKANGLYQEGEYEAALAAYRTIISSGFESRHLYYNMGNAAFRSNNIGQAILYYEKTLKLDPSHEDAIHNLEYVSQYRIDAFEPVPELFISSWMQTLVNSSSERAWSMLAILLFAVALGSLIMYLFAKSLALKKAGFFTALLGLVLFGLTLTFALSQNRSIVKPDTAIILSPSVVVRSSPSDSGTELFILHEGTKVHVSEEVSGWHNIRVIDGREGWILGDDFESI